MSFSLRKSILRRNKPVLSFLFPNPSQQIKSQKFSIVAPSPNHYQMDIVFFGKYLYLLIVGTNNRYAWFEEIESRKKKAVKKAIETIIKEDTFRNMFPIIIDCDGERSFEALKTGTYFILPDGMSSNNKIVINSNPDPFHNRLAIINRLIRTIRDYAFKAEGTDSDIEPQLLERVLDYYNNWPQQTLSNLIGFYVSPNEVLHDLELEAFIVKKLINQNAKLRKEKMLDIGDKVLVSHMKQSLFEKVRFRIEPGVYKIKSFKGKMYEVESLDGKNKMVVPGYFLTKI
jgi:hypothetical protein